MKRLSEAKELVGRARTKFFTFTVVGAFLLLGACVLVYQYQAEMVEKQAIVFDLYDLVGDQVSLVQETSLLVDELLEGSLKSSKKIRNNLNSSQEKHAELSALLKSSSFLASAETVDSRNLEELGKRLSSYQDEVKDLADLYDRKQLRFDSEIIDGERDSIQSHRHSVVDELRAMKGAIETRQQISLGVVKRTSVFLVVFLILIMVLVWVAVFRPLYMTALTLHGRLYEEVEKKNQMAKARTDFLANISHEIRTPMTAIVGYSEALRNPKLQPSDISSYVSSISKNSDHLLSLINEILDMSKIESGKFSVEKEDIELGGVVNEVKSLMLVKAKEKGIDLSFSADGSLPRHIFTDEKRLKQILFNLVGNAIKFTSDGFVRVNLRFRQAQKSLIFEVEDSGCGIPKEKLETVFRPFEQADGSVNRKFGGTGLGLALSKSLANSLGGDVSVSSTGPAGTVMICELDISGVEQVDLADDVLDSAVIEDSSDDDVFEPNNELLGTNIVVVDDAKENARLFSIYLESAGANVEVANGGEEALRLGLMERQDEISIMLLDLQMPDKDGYQVINELKRSGIKYPVAALTAHAMSEERKRVKKAGFDAHFVKPISHKKLVRSIQGVLKI